MSKKSLKNHARKYASIGKSTRISTITGVYLNSLANSMKTNSLLHDLMAVEIIVEKKIATGKKNYTFHVRLLYAIIPDKISKSVTCYYLCADLFEVRSVARGILICKISLSSRLGFFLLI